MLYDAKCNSDRKMKVKKNNESLLLWGFDWLWLRVFGIYGDFVAVEGRIEELADC